MTATPAAPGLTPGCGRRPWLMASALGLAAWLSGCASPGPTPAPAAPVAPAASARRYSGPTAQAAAERLLALMDASDEASQQRNPVGALYRGDYRRADQLSDYPSPAYVRAEHQAAVDDLAALATIPRQALDAQDQLLHDTFAWQRQDARAYFSPALADVWARLPIDHYSGFHLTFSQLASGDSAAPFRDGADYEAGLARLKAYAHFLGRCEQRMVEGLDRGIVLPRLLAERLQVQMAELGDQAPGESPFLKPTRHYPDSVPEAQRGRYTALYTQAVEGSVRPAHRRFARFLAERYLPAARPGTGLSELPGGRALYEHLVRSQTTLDLAPEAIHELGLHEVDKLTQGMGAIARQLGHAGSLGTFFDHLRTDPRYRPASAAAMQAGYAAIAARVDAGLDRLFLHRPRTPLEIKPVPELEAPTAPGAYYTGGSLEAGRAGVFYFNTHDLASRSTYGMETLYLHEAVPGHHYQGSLAAEDETLPKLLRYEGGPAYWEGWALYAESLGPELGLYTDPLQHFGHLNDAMLRAMRLVVDTGLHVKGWRHAQAVDYMLAHSAMSRTEVVAEVERYIADPGQALAYKLGELHIRGLRQQAESTLGARFDLRAFHDQVLNTGALPLTVLARKIEAWIGERASAAASA